MSTEAKITRGRFALEPDGKIIDRSSGWRFSAMDARHLAWVVEKAKKCNAKLWSGIYRKRS